MGEKRKIEEATMKPSKPCDKLCDVWKRDRIWCFPFGGWRWQCRDPVGINKPLLPRGCVSVVHTTTCLDVTGRFSVRLGDAEGWHVWNAEVCIDLCSVLARCVNGGVDELVEWKTVILSDFEIVWELCRWEWFNTIPRLFWSSLSSLNTVWNWPTGKTIPVRVDTDIRYVM